jgi:hypothetical protein
MTGGWAIASDGLQWVLQRRQGDGWQAVKFIRLAPKTPSDFSKGFPTPSMNGHLGPVMTWLPPRRHEAP